MWKKVPMLIVRCRSSIRTLYKISLLRFLLVFLIVIFLCLGWEKWLLSIPQPLPQQSVLFVNKNTELMDGNYYETSVPPIGNAKYSSAAYRIWIPDNIQILRGLIVKQHGCGDPAASTGLNHANDLQWQALASRHQFALMGTKLSVGDRLCDDWALLDSGSENAFLKALHHFAGKSHHTELDKAPWVFWGHSGGADWVAQMLQKYPDRTVATVLMRCGGSTFPATTGNASVLRVPILFAIADKETVNAGECRDLAKDVFYRYRRAGAFWALALEIETGHESGNTRLIAIPYLDAILNMRLTKSQGTLRPVNEAQGWLGDPATHDIAPMNQYPGKPFEAAWLPNEGTARKWQQYVSTNAWNRLSYNICRVERFFVIHMSQHSTKNCYPDKLLPAQKPAAPTDVQATRIGKTEVILAWKFSPDLENGLPAFRIYRNGSLIKTLQGQEHNFGDAPEPPRVALEFRDETRKDAVYAVSAFNDLGESLSQTVQLSGAGLNRIKNTVEPVAVVNAQ